MECFINIISLETFWSALGSISTLIAVLYVLYPDVIKNTLIPIKLELEFITNCEKAEITEYVNTKESFLNSEKKSEEKRTYYYFHLKLINKNLKRKVDNSKVKFIGVKYSELENNNIIYFNVPRSLTFAPAEENIEFASFLNYQIIDFLKFSSSSNKNPTICLQNNITFEQSKISPNQRTNIYLEIQAEGMTKKLIYEIGILWNGEIGSNESQMNGNVKIDKPVIFKNNKI